MSSLENTSECPIDIALQYLGKKWTFHIIRDLFFGITHFNKIKNNNQGLTSKVLSERLEELQDHEIVEKVVTDKYPNIEYRLTEKGRALNKVLFELALFSLKTCPEFNKIPIEIACCSEKFKEFVEALNLKEKITEI